MVTRRRASEAGGLLLVTDDVVALVGNPDQPRIPHDAGDEPDIGLLGGVEAENAEDFAERAWERQESPPAARSA